MRTHNTQDTRDMRRPGSPQRRQSQCRGQNQQSPRNLSTKILRYTTEDGTLLLLVQIHPTVTPELGHHVVIINICESNRVGNSPHTFLVFQVFSNDPGKSASISSGLDEATNWFNRVTIAIELEVVQVNSHFHI